MDLTITKQPVNSTDILPIIILNWNGEEDTIDCLKSVKAAIPAGFVPVLVDNGSCPDSVERLKNECRRIFARIVFLKAGELAEHNEHVQTSFSLDVGEDCLVFIENGENLGFAKGNNVGIRFADLVGAEWAMLLNNDTIVSPDCFRELQRFVKSHQSFMAVTPQIRYHTPNTRVQNCGGDLTYFGSRRYRFANWEISTVRASDFSIITFVTGCALLFKFKVTGPLTEDFFFGEEDYEFSLRMKKRGLRMACVHGAVVFHKVGASIRRSSKPMGAIIVHYVNRLINTRNYYCKSRWQATRLFAYLYLPILLARNGIDPRKSTSAIRTINSYVTLNNQVSRSEFLSLIVSNG